MVNTKFEAYKVKRELKRSGIDYEFKRPKENTFGEETKEFEGIGKLRGLYHEQNNYISVTTADSSRRGAKKVPMILCLYEDAAFLNLQIGDLVEINSKHFKVNGVVNIQEWNIIADISLEVVDGVVQA